MEKHEKTVLYVAGAGAGVLLIYRLYQGNNQTAANAGTAATDQTASDYASLAGQEQADVAALQSQNSQLQQELESLLHPPPPPILPEKTYPGGKGGPQGPGPQGAGAPAPSSGLTPEQVQWILVGTGQIPNPNTVPEVASGSTPTFPSAQPWTNPAFFTMTLGQVINSFRSPEATARYLFAKGFRPEGPGGVIASGFGSGYQYGSNVAGQIWRYIGPAGKDPEPLRQYTIGAHG